VEGGSFSVVFPCTAIIALSTWARFPGTIEMSLNREKIVDGCNCGFGKACSGIFLEQLLDRRMLSLLIRMPILSTVLQLTVIS